jgi:hypothetical protein
MVTPCAESNMESSRDVPIRGKVVRKPWFEIGAGLAIGNILTLYMPASKGVNADAMNRAM